MIKTNSILFKNKLKKLIIDNYTGDYPSGRNLDFEDVKKYLFEKFKTEYFSSNQINRLKYNYITLKDLFTEYLQGLPCGFPCLYYPYYGNLDAWEWLKDALEESDDEARRFNYGQAADLIASKMYDLLEINKQFYKL